jgi:citrate synthase
VNTPWSTAIARVDVDDVLVRGYPLSELVGEVSFVDMVFLVHTGELPDLHRRRMLDAVFVTLIEHGISPSTIISRELATCGTPMQAAIAGGVLSIADWHGGSGEDLAETLVALLERAGADAGDEQIEAVATDHVRARHSAGMRFEGFGHPQHPEGDPRAGTLLRLADECGTAGDATRLLRTLAAVITREVGKSLPPNVTGAVAAVLLDLGFSWRAMRGLVIAPRTAGLAAHVVEELDQGARWRHAPADEIEYTGPALRALDRKGAAT